jgi:hypothetical protein
MWNISRRKSKKTSITFEYYRKKLSVKIIIYSTLLKTTTSGTQKNHYKKSKRKKLSLPQSHKRFVWNRKRRVKLCLLAYAPILYLKYLRESNRKHLDLINTFIKAAAHEIKILYTNNELSEKEMMKKIPFHNSFKKNI